MAYIPNTPEERRQMMETIGIDDIGRLFEDIPEGGRLNGPLNLSQAISEYDLRKHFEALCAENSSHLSFLGAGSYDHFSPAVVNHMMLRGEFFTAYTPYQPEVAQGTLQVIFEFQTLICNLTGMEAANASLYDGSTALAEAALMACRATKRGRIVVSQALHPQYRQVLNTYLEAQELEISEVPAEGGETDAAAAESEICDETAALIVQNPNFFGGIEALEKLAEIAHAKKALLIVCITEPTSLGLLKSPGAAGADIAVGEGQGFGAPVGYGGPYVGFLATQEKLMRQMPGRLCGMTKDAKGRRGFVLTLQAREQHIRRARANSNICTNQGLYALCTTIHLAALGKKGVRELAEQNARKAHYAARRIQEETSLKLWNRGEFYNEFTLEGDGIADLTLKLRKQGIAAGLVNGGRLIVCITETKSKSDIDRLVAALAEA